MDRPSKFPIIPTTTQRIMMVIGTTQKLTLHPHCNLSRFKGAPCCFYETTTRAYIGESLVRRNNCLFSSVDTQDVKETMDQNLLNGQDDSSEVEAPLSSPPQVAPPPQCAEAP